ncbi:hypothetical protein BGZ52_010501, partial [Haplosporangium bisporale]
LGALKNLRESNLYGLNTEIDVEEAEWMMRAWPFLDTICGLLEFSPARIWLEKNHPQLALNRCPFYPTAGPLLLESRANTEYDKRVYDSIKNFYFLTLGISVESFDRH